VADQRQHREDRLHQHAVLPLSTLTKFEVTRIALGGMAAHIAQDNHAVFVLSNEPLKGVIRHVGGGTLPGDHQSPLIFILTNDKSLTGVQRWALIMASASLVPPVSPMPVPTCSLAIEVPGDRIWVDPQRFARCPGSRRCSSLRSPRLSRA